MAIHFRNWTIKSGIRNQESIIPTYFPVYFPNFSPISDIKFQHLRTSGFSPIQIRAVLATRTSIGDLYKNTDHQCDWEVLIYILIRNKNRNFSESQTLRNQRRNRRLMTNREAVYKVHDMDACTCTRNEMCRQCTIKDTDQMCCITYVWCGMFVSAAVSATNFF